MIVTGQIENDWKIHFNKKFCEKNMVNKRKYIIWTLKRTVFLKGD